MSFVGHLQFGHLIRINQLSSLFFVIAIDDHQALHVVDVTDRPGQTIPLFVPMAQRQHWAWDQLQQIQFVDTSHMGGWLAYYHFQHEDRLSISLESDPASCIQIRILSIQQDACFAEVLATHETIFLDFAFRGLHTGLGLFAVARIHDSVDPSPLPDSIHSSTTPSSTNMILTPPPELRPYVAFDTHEQRYRLMRSQVAAPPPSPRPPRYQPFEGTVRWGVIKRTFDQEQHQRVLRVPAEERLRWRNTLPLERQFVERERAGWLPPWTKRDVSADAQRPAPLVEAVPMFQLPESMMTRFPKLLAKRFTKAPTVKDVFFDPDLDDLDYRFVDTLPKNDSLRESLRRIVTAHVRPWPAYLSLEELLTTLMSKQRPVQDNCYGIHSHKTQPLYYVFQRGQWFLLQTAVEPLFVNVITARQQNTLTPYFRLKREQPTTKKGSTDTTTTTIPKLSTTAVDRRRKWRQMREEQQPHQLTIAAQMIPDVLLTKEEQHPRWREVEDPVTCLRCPKSEATMVWLQQTADFVDGEWVHRETGQTLELVEKTKGVVWTPPPSSTVSTTPPRLLPWQVWDQAIRISLAEDHPKRMAWVSPEGTLHWYRFAQSYRTVLQWLSDGTDPTTMEQFWWIVCRQQQHPGFRQYLRNMQVDVDVSTVVPRAWEKTGWPTLATQWLLRYASMDQECIQVCDDWVSKAIEVVKTTDSECVEEATFYRSVATILAPQWIPELDQASMNAMTWIGWTERFRGNIPRWVWARRQYPIPPSSWLGHRQALYWGWLTNIVGGDDTFANVPVGTDEHEESLRSR